MTYKNGYGDEAIRVFKESGEIDWKPNKNSKISQFYNGKHILVTGATGFLGKLVVEKLLRASPDLEAIYIVVREKKGQNVEDRISKLYQDPIFGPLSKLYPNFQKKIKIIKGDISEPNLGIHPNDELHLRLNLNVILHIAATVRFNEAISKAICSNVRAARDLLILASKCANLESYLHVSTAYSNALNNKSIDERFYSFPFNPDDLITMSETMEADELNRKSKSMLGEWPNTYTFTKAAAEQVVRMYGEKLPICVFRPAIIVATYKEPLRSWIDNLYGVTGVVVGAGTGVLKTLHVNTENVAEMVPADYVVNGMIAAAYNTSIKHDSKVIIYNYVSSEENPIYWTNIFEECLRYGYEVPSIKAISHISIKLTRFKWLYLIYAFFLHFIPGYIMDFGMILTGHKPIMTNIYRKITKFGDVLDYFSMRFWKFSNLNTQNLWTTLNQADKDLFPFSMAELSWKEFHKTHVLGLRVYLVKDDLSTIDQARKKATKLYIVHIALKCLFYLFVLRVMYFTYQILCYFIY